jgi:ribosomal protein L11 methylase PrmA
MKNIVTLDIDPNLIKQAKSYAKKNKVSLSLLIENYLSSLTKKIEINTKVSPLVESLTGVISLKENDYKNVKCFLDSKKL